MRRYAIVMVSVVTSLFCPAQAQPLSVDETLALRDRMASGAFAARAEWNALTYYLQGVVEGAVGYNETLATQSKAAAFCPPTNKDYSIDEMLRFLAETKRDERSQPASLVILEAYAQQYPCSAQ